ncbi:hypothetical protein [Streptomyces sp. TRM68416]|uniref:hypothetical protein n=1 Tax=Streptomyces sp. TRM68416 TaxID=2758412 RepID=UPI001CB719FE|nr:hypothetical protein [Streptomyces sp. TRM68416]
MASGAKALMWAGIGLCAAGAAGLVVGAVLDVEGADPWASAAGGVAGLLGLAVTVYALLRPAPSPAPVPGPAPTCGAVNAGGTRSIAAGGNIGSASTGDGAIAGPPPTLPAPPSRPANGPVTASGDRSIAAGGDIGSASTGDA